MARIEGLPQNRRGQRRDADARWRAEFFALPFVGSPIRRITLITPSPFRLCIDTRPSLNTLERLHEDGCILG